MLVVLDVYFFVDSYANIYNIYNDCLHKELLEKQNGKEVARRKQGIYRIMEADVITIPTSRKDYF